MLEKRHRRIVDNAEGGINDSDNSARALIGFFCYDGNNSSDNCSLAAFVSGWLFRRGFRAERAILFLLRRWRAKSRNSYVIATVGTFRLKVNSDRVRSNSVTCTDEAGNDVDVVFFYGRQRQGMSMVSAAMKNLCDYF